MLDFFTDPGRALAARAPDSLIGWRAAVPLPQAAFLLRVGAWRALTGRTPGRNVALYLEDSIEFAAALLGAWQSGKTVWLTADTLAASCSALAGSVDAFLGEFPSAQAPLLPGPHDVCPAALGALDPGFDALVVYTSGSTGAAQAIPKQLAQLSSEVATLEALFGPRIDQAEIVATVSHQHIYGLLFKVLWPLAAGRAIHAHSLNFPEQLAHVLGTRNCVLVTSPAHLKRLPGHLAWAAAAQHLCAVFSSGGPLATEAAFAAANLLGQTPIEVYGSSETGGIGWRQRQPGDIGAWLALPNVEWRVAIDDNLLEVRSPHLDGDGWLRLADRVQATGSGRFLLLGRSDRIVKIEEKRISLDALEAALSASSLVVDARVIVCGEVAGRRQQLAAFVVASEQGRLVLAEGGKLALNRRLRALLAGAVEAVGAPRRWRYLDQMPLDAQGKTTHAQLLALLDGVLDAGPDPRPRPRVPQLRLLERTPQRVLFELYVPATLFYLDGHFPLAPVLPGVVQLDWAILYGRQYFDLAPTFRAIHGLKFQHVIRPEHPLQLELVHDAHKESLSFRYFSSAGQHSSGRILFQAPLGP